VPESLPLFPLQTVLLPGGRLPLHIFEPRYRQLIVDLYRENRLMNGTMKLRGEPVNLANVKANLLVVEATEDHIVPPCETEGAFATFGSRDKELIKSPGGHIGIMAGSSARKKMWPAIEGWLALRSGEKGA